eukprot:7947855-Alexandrium_andersonii.AAC.1
MPRRLTFAPTATMYLSISTWELFAGMGMASAGACPWCLVHFREVGVVVPDRDLRALVHGLA